MFLGEKAFLFSQFNRIQEGKKTTIPIINYILKSNRFEKFNQSKGSNIFNQSE